MQGGFKRLPLAGWCSVPYYSIKLSTYDPGIIDAFDRLRKNRKQASFTQEALKHFLSTERGIQVLLLMERKTIEQSSAITVLFPEKINYGEASAERTIGSNDLLSTMSIDSGSVLDSILK